MPVSIFKKIYQQVVLLLVVALVLVAAYVSAGRQFMPAVSRYGSFLENQIFELTGVPVSIDSLTGSFQGFNPVIRVNGLSLLVGEDAPQRSDPAASALVFDSATLIVNMPRSIWQRRWVLEDFVIESLDIDVEQTPAGNWQLSGLSMGGDGNADLNSLYQSFQRVSRLNLRNVAINVRSNTGAAFRFVNGSATIQNMNQSHYLHVNGNLEDGSQQIAFSFEAEGDELSEIDGQLHVLLPEDDYSEMLAGQVLAGVTIQEFYGGGDFWIALENGGIEGVTSQAKVDSVTLLPSGANSITLDNIDGTSVVRRGNEAGHWEVLLDDMEISWQDQYWRPINAYFYLAPQESLLVRASSINLGFLSRFLISSGFLDEGAASQVEQYAPRGSMENLDLFLPFTDASEQALQLKTNLSGLQLASVEGSPNMWGINGYAEFEYDDDARQVVGFAEVESDEFSINIPSVFTDVWDYSYVNGRLGFRVDLNNGQETRLVSSVIIANSDAVDGRAQFTSTLHVSPDGERETSLELLIGALRVDAELKSLYLPDGPNITQGLRGSMAWLDTAILDGEVFDSGVIFRGSTVPGSAPEAKTFQSFYQLEGGELSFSDDWPALHELSGIVFTDDNKIDIEVLSGNSLGIDMGSVGGAIRINEQGENWLQVAGQAAGPTANGLDYVQQAPVGEALKNTFANWEAVGEFAADINVAVPLGQPQADTEVRLNIAIADNRITIPDYALQVEQLTGPVIFDTTTGLEDSELAGELFDQPVAIELSSQFSDGDLDTIIVNVQGSSTPQDLIDWPLQGEFVRDLLGAMEGEVAFNATLRLPQDIDSAASNSLAIDSTLSGVALSLPHPFNKPEGEELPLHLDFTFGEMEQQVAGTLGPRLAFELELLEGTVRDGLVYLGEQGGGIESLVANDIQGLVILGEMDRFILEQWIEFLDRLSTEGSPSEELSDSVAFVDLAIDTLDFYDQELADVVMRIEPNVIDQHWAVYLTSDSILGQVNLPFDSEDYIELDLDYLLLPADEEELLAETALQESVAGAEVGEPEAEEEEIERIDVLAGIDPRQLPRMNFATDNFSIGSRPYGSWQFTLDPNANGAEISELVFDFRGLRLGIDDVQPVDEQTEEVVARLQPHFNWFYDGQEHRSELTGILYADDMADVLTANGYAASFESDSAVFYTDIAWPGSPAFFAASGLSGELDVDIEDGRFLQGAGGPGALKLISIINFDAIMRRLRFSDDLLRSGLAYDEIRGQFELEDGVVNIEDRLVISGPSSLYQITGEIDLADETILGEMYVTLPVSDNIPWLGLLTANLPLAVGAYLFDRIFGDQVDSLTSAVYTLDGPWEGLEPEFKQAFGSPDDPDSGDAALQ